MTREELEFEMVSLAKDFVSQRRLGEAGLKVMVRMMIDKVIESKLHQPTVISAVCENPHCNDGVTMELYGEKYYCHVCRDKQTDL